MKIKIKTDFIKLSQLIKLSNIVSQGSDAKMFILDGKVKLNGETVFERGKKVYPGDEVIVAGFEKINVVSASSE